MKTKLISHGFSIVAVFLLFQPLTNFAGSATWSVNPANGDWNTATNWTPATIPNANADIATFATSNITGVSTSSPIRVSEILFDVGASPFTITGSGTESLDFTGPGVANNSGILQNFVISHLTTMHFLNSSSAGGKTAYLVTGDTVADPEGHAFMSFESGANAGAANITINGGEAGGVGGHVTFKNRAMSNKAKILVKGSTDPNVATEGGVLEFAGYSGSAGTSQIEVEGGGAGPNSGGKVTFADTGAGRATITVNGGDGAGAAPGFVIFSPDFFTSGGTAGNATLIANGGVNGGQGGQIQFSTDSTADDARVILFDNGTVDLSAHYDYPGITIGSIEGSGRIVTGVTALAVGSNNLDTRWSGVITGRGSFTKVGTGTLTISRPNDLVAGININEGTVLVTNKKGFAFGAGPLSVDGGTLGGTGKIGGGLAIIGTHDPSSLAPGVGTTPGTLTFTSGLTIGELCTFLVDLNSDNQTADQVTARGILLFTCCSSAPSIALTDYGNTTLPSGTSFTIINTTLPGAIDGTFGNLPDGGLITVGNNTYQANYEGGDGNDLTLTVQ